MGDHFIRKCSKCETTISQCRCISCDKTLTYSICSKCASQEQKIDLSIGDSIAVLDAFFDCDKHPTAKEAWKTIKIHCR